MKRNGTMVTVRQVCNTCSGYTWRSQPLVLGRYPAGNILLSFGILMAGASVSKVLLVLKHMGLCAYTARNFFLHQSKFLFPAVLQYWEKSQKKILDEIKNLKNAVWSGDGRYDSMGHSAKYGAYTMFCCTVGKIAHFELVQVNKLISIYFDKVFNKKYAFEALVPVLMQNRYTNVRGNKPKLVYIKN